MKGQKKKQKGITLIALVISIIVMLILAGVSLNMTVGDNGIIKQAQQATIQNSVAILQEFLQQKYVLEELDKVVEATDDGSEASNLEKMIKRHPEWFFSSGTYDYVLVEYEHDNNGTKKVDYLKLRLIDKQGLNKDNADIVNQIVGGDASSVDDFLNLRDVYGVTSNLEVFYCADGLASYIGANYANSDLLDGTKQLYAANSPLSKALAETSGGEPKSLSMSDLYGIKEITISDAAGLTDLTSLYDLPNLTKLTLKNYKGSLKGIETATKLDYLEFNNASGSLSIDYTNLRYCTTITQLYFYMPTDAEVNKLMTEMSHADYKRLATIGLYGYASFTYEEWDRHLSDFYSENRSTFSNLSYLNKLTKETKHAVKVLYLQNNDISTINLNFSATDGFNQVIGFHIFSNNITSLIGLKDATTIRNLSLEYNPITDLTNIPLTSLSSLRIYDTGITSLYPLINGNLGYLDAYNLTNLNFSDSTIWKKADYEKIGKISRVIIDSKYDLYFNNKSNITVPTNYSSAEFETALTGNTYITHLNLNGNTNLTNTAINNVIKSLTNLHYLNADNTNLSDLNGLTNKNTILGIRLNNTRVTSLKPLLASANNSLYAIYCSNEGLVIDSNDINMFNTVMNRKTTLWNNPTVGTIGGFCSYNINILKKFENSNITTFFDSGASCSGVLDLTGCSQLSYAYARGGYGLTIKVPKTIGLISLHDSGATMQLPSNETVAYVDQYCSAHSLSVNGGNVHKIQVNTRTNSTTEVNLSTWLSSVNPSIFVLTNDNSTYRPKINYSYFANWNALTELDWYYTNIENLDLLKKLKSSNTLTTLKLSHNKISDLTTLIDIHDDNVAKNLNNLENVTTLCLDDNALYSINGLTPEALPLLTTLYLNNNYIQNYVTYVKSDGTKDTILTSEYLARFPKLTYINLSGNASVTDLSGLTKSSVGFSNNNGVLTRTLSQ